MKSAFSLICIQLITHIRNTSNFNYEVNKYFQELYNIKCFRGYKKQQQLCCLKAKLYHNKGIPGILGWIINVLFLQGKELELSKYICIFA